MTRTSRNLTVGVIAILGLAGMGRAVCADKAPSSTVMPVDDQDLETPDRIPRPRTVSQVLDWNQIFVDTLVATNTANSSSQRLGAIVHTAIFDAFDGIQQRYTPIFVHDRAPDGASRRAAVIAAAYTALVGLFPSQQPALDASYAASVAALSDECDDTTRSHRRWQACVSRIERGIALGNRGRAGGARLARDRWVHP